jgi:endonuclease YncB( thermonuclease family)
MKQFKFNAVILRIIDGDSCLVKLDLGFQIYHETRIRLARIDAPELNSSDPQVRNMARIAAEHLKKYAGDSCEIETHKSDKYARYIGEVVTGGVNLSDEMLKLGFAVEYKGK